nr:pentapeptide repeat-containing protein [uncultured Methanoregula sp.]
MSDQISPISNEKFAETLIQNVQKFNDLRQTFPTHKIEFIDLDFTHENFEGANFENITFIEVDLRQSNLAKTNLKNSQFKSSNLTRVDLFNSTLENAKLIDSTLSTSNLLNVNLSNGEIIDTYLFGVNFKNANLSNVKLKNAHISDLNLENTNLQRADLSNSELMRVNLKNAALVDANLFGSNLSDSQLDYSNLYRANFENANLQGAKIQFAHLSEANFTNANLNWVDMSESEGHCINFNAASLYEANLRNVNFNASNFNKANLKKAHLRDANLNNSNISNADFTWTNLRSSKIQDAIIYNTNMSRANMSWAELQGTKFNETDFTYSLFVESDINKTVFENCTIYGISAWDLKGSPKKISNLTITKPHEPKITIDSLEFAQFMYFLINNKDIHKILSGIKSKIVLIMGHYSNNNSDIIDVIFTQLKNFNKVPVLLDFDKPLKKEFFPTLRVLAQLSQFIIADISDVKGVGPALSMFLPQLSSVPIIIIKNKNTEKDSILEKVFDSYSNISPIVYFNDKFEINEVFKNKIIYPAESSNQS